MNIQKKIIISVLIVVVLGGIVYFNSQKVSRGTTDSVPIQTVFGVKNKANMYEPAKEITTPDGFINTLNKPVTIGEFVGKKVILVDFWTYSCINCQRTTPYLNAWYEKYKDKGLVIIGVHTPEFDFEKDYNNVSEAVKRMKIKYPVVLDNDFSTWNAYKNRFWPRKYLIDINGYVVYDHIGEGGYEETENKIQELLEERKTVLGLNDDAGQAVLVPPNIVESGVYHKLSPEIYFGASRNSYLGNGKTNTIGVQNFSEKKDPQIDTLYLDGDWNIREEYAENLKAEAKIIFHYQAKNVYFVAGSEKPVKIKIIKDGKMFGEQIVNAHSLYILIQDDKYGEHVLEIIIEKSGLKAYTFTFG